MGPNVRHFIEDEDQCGKVLHMYAEGDRQDCR